MPCLQPYLYSKNYSLLYKDVEELFLKKILCQRFKGSLQLEPRCERKFAISHTTRIVTALLSEDEEDRVFLDVCSSKWFADVYATACDAVAEFCPETRDVAPTVFAIGLESGLVHFIFILECLVHG